MGDSDDEVYLQRASDDEEECHHLSGIVPNLQLRYVKSIARWNDEIVMAEVIEKKGKVWVTTGIARNGKIYCSVEDTLYLMELGALNLSDNSDRRMNLTDLYSKVACRKGGCSWELFEVYKHLKSPGYVVGQHGVAWSLKGVDNADTPVLLGSAEESKHELVDVGSKDKLSINLLFSKMHINELRPDFDVYLPNNRGGPPSRAKVEVLERQCDGILLKIGRGYLLNMHLLDTQRNFCLLRSNLIASSLICLFDDEFKIPEQIYNRDFGYDAVYPWRLSQVHNGPRTHCFLPPFMRSKFMNYRSH